MKVYEMLDVNKKEVLFLWNNYYNINISIEILTKVLKDLKTRKPIDSDTTLCFDMYDDMVSVYCMHDGERYAITFIPWDEVLGYEVDNSLNLTDIELLTHFLYELTWDGWEESQMEERANELAEMVKTIEEGTDNLISLDDFIASLNDKFNKNIDLDEIPDIDEDIEQ